MKLLKNLAETLAYTLFIAIVWFLISIVAPMLCQAKEYKLIELNELSLDYKNYSAISSGSRYMLIYPEKPKESLNILMNFDILNYFYWNNTVESVTTTSQYRGIGLQTAIGLRVMPQMDIGLYHHSQHVLDGKHAFMDNFPVDDSVQIKIYIYKKNRDATLLDTIWSAF